MGTERKSNNCTENTSTGGGNNIPEVLAVKGDSSKLINKENAHINFSGGSNLNGKALSPVNSYTKGIISSTEIPYLPLYIDENNVIDGAKEVLKLIRPKWNLKAVVFKKFTDGITNKLVGCFYEPNEATNGNCTNGNAKRNASDIEETNGSILQSNDDNNDSGNLSDTESDDNSDSEICTATATTTTHSASTESTNNVVLVRVYGNKTDLLIDRKAERRNILLLHSYGFAPSLYATFQNGLAYDYVPGVTLNANNILQPEVWRLVACRMAEMHRDVNTLGGSNAATASATKLCIANDLNGSCQNNVNVNVDADVNVDATAPRVPMLWKKTQSFLDLVPEQFSDVDKHKRLEGTFLPISRVREEFERLYRRLEALDSPLVFAHNDLLLGNVVYTESRNTVNFIDYEYADYNFQAFDIGNHFAEFAGVDVVDYDRYPKREFQLEWLRVYLQTYLQRTDVTAAEVERLYVQVNQFALASHIFWAIWSLIQAEHSKLDFDYVDYAFVRYNEYLAKKDEFLALSNDGDVDATYSS